MDNKNILNRHSKVNNREKNGLGWALIVKKKKKKKEDNLL